VVVYGSHSVDRTLWFALCGSHSVVTNCPEATAEYAHRSWSKNYGLLTTDYGLLTTDY